MATQDYTINRGSDWTLDITVNDTSGSALNITGYTFYMYLWSSAIDNPDLTLDNDGTGGISITTAASGELTVTITDAQSEALSPHLTYEYEFHVKDGTDNEEMLLSGEITFTDRARAYV